MGKKKPWTRITDTIDILSLILSLRFWYLVVDSIYIRLYGLGSGLCSSYSLTPVYIL